MSRPTRGDGAGNAGSPEETQNHPSNGKSEIGVIPNFTNAVIYSVGTLGTILTILGGLFFSLGPDHINLGLLFVSIGVILLAVAAGIFLIVGKHADEKQPLSLVPHQARRELAASLGDDDALLTMSIGTTLDACKPFETRFVVTNQSRNSIHDLTYTTEIWDFEYAGPIRVGMDLSVPLAELRPKHEFTLFCGFGDRLPGMDDPMEANVIILQIRLKYIYRSEPVEEGFRFFAKRDAGGHYKWFPQGKAVALKDAKAGLEKRPKKVLWDPEPLKNNRALLRVAAILLAEPLSGTNRILNGQIGVLNTGKTAACNEIWAMGIKFGQDFATARGEASPKKPVEGAVIPHLLTWIPYHIEIDRPRVEAILKKETNLYLFGTIEYDDASGVRGELSFDHRYDPESGQFESGYGSAEPAS